MKSFPMFTNVRVEVMVPWCARCPCDYVGMTVPIAGFVMVAAQVRAAAAVDSSPSVTARAGSYLFGCA